MPSSKWQRHLYLGFLTPHPLHLVSIFVCLFVTCLNNKYFFLLAGEEQDTKGVELVNSHRQESGRGGKEHVMKGCVRGELCQGHFPLIVRVFGKYSPLCIMKGWRNWLILRDHELMHMHGITDAQACVMSAFSFVFSGCVCV